jgi:hypothetical protein
VLEVTSDVAGAVVTIGGLEGSEADATLGALDLAAGVANGEAGEALNGASEVVGAVVDSTGLEGVGVDVAFAAFDVATTVVEDDSDDTGDRVFNALSEAGEHVMSIAA